MTPLLDMNVVLDVLLARQPWLAEAEAIWEAHQKTQIAAALAAFSVPTIFYVVRRHSDLSHAHDAVRLCLATFEIIPVQKSTLECAHNLPGNDFEDKLQVACAIEGQRDCIVTRDLSGFAGSPVPILTPAALLAQLSQQSP